MSIIDWESAGLCPEYWEYTSACQVHPFALFWRDDIGKFIQPEVFRRYDLLYMKAGGHLHSNCLNYSVNSVFLIMSKVGGLLELKFLVPSNVCCSFFLRT